MSLTRAGMLKRFREHSGVWDLIVIGGGATGVGVAVDAASRGYKTLLLEQSDFGKGTSSRSTKLVHGGVRYLEQGDIPLVMEALKERGLLRQNAPHLVTNLAFVVPSYEWWEGPFYGVGLRLYNMLAGKYGFGPSKNLSKEETLERLPTIEKAGLRGGVVYYDGQFDDSRLLLNLVQTAAEQGATLLNYAPVTGFVFGDDGLVDGVTAEDAETGATLRAEAKVVINATGAFGDSVRKLAAPKAQEMIAPSQGVHVVLDRSFLPGDTAIMVPHTSDGRVMFAIPWHGHTLVGTTDTPIAEASLEPRALSQEIDFLLETTTLYLDRAVTRENVLSVFAGVRPLVKAGGGGNTAALSRSHTVHIDESGLLTITGGKWTTYRNMAEDCVNHATTLGKLEERPCITRQLKIHGYDEMASEHGHLRVYGSDAESVLELAAADATLGEPLHRDLPYLAAQVVFAARNEMARTVDDVLSRRLRATFLNARAAMAMAPRVARILAKELGRDEAWRDEQVRAFVALAEGYLP